MKLTLQNIGPIKDSTINISHLTVLSGTNTIATSTISKALYATLNTISNKIQDSLAPEVTSILTKRIGPYTVRSSSSCVLDFINYEPYHFFSREDWIQLMLLDLLSNTYNNGYKEKIEIGNTLKNKYNMYAMDVSNSDEIPSFMLEPLVTDIKDDLMEILYKNPNDYIMPIIESELNNVFSSNICSKDCKDISEIYLETNSNTLSVKLSEDKVRKAVLLNGISYKANVYYIDNLDSIGISKGKPLEFMPYHKRELIKDILFFQNSIASNFSNDSEFTGYSNDNVLINGENYEAIYTLWHTFNGYLNNDKEQLIYINSDTNESQSFSSLSPSMKLLTILQTVVCKLIVAGDSYLIIDTSDIKLEPNMKDVLAEFLVLLTHDSKITVLLTTNDPDLIESISEFSIKENAVGECSYYQIEDNATSSSIIDCSSNITDFNKD